LGRGRFGRYEVLDFLAPLFGSALSGERTLQVFFDRLQSFAAPFLALFEQGELPYRSPLSRFLAAVDRPCLEALRALSARVDYLEMDPRGNWWPVGSDRSGQR